MYDSRKEIDLIKLERQASAGMINKQGSQEISVSDIVSRTL